MRDEAWTCAQLLLVTVFMPSNALLLYEYTVDVDTLYDHLYVVMISLFLFRFPTVES